ncbi:MAG: STN domain-containing protein [Cytophagales bacterium]|nr:STN domain-containing protein [Cytophagales bacterium]
MRQLITSVMCFVAVTVWSQSNLITLDLQEASAQEAMAQVMAQTNYQFAYNPDVLKDDPITLSLNQVQIDKALDKLFAQNYQVKVRGSYVVLLPRKQEESAPKKNSIQIKGAVLEASTNRQLEDVTIYEVQTLKPVFTDASGNYSLEIELPDEVAFIAISKEHYQDTVIQVKRNEFWKISLRRKDKAPKAKEEKVDKVQQKFLSDKISMHAKNVNLTERRFFQLALTPGLSTNGFLSGQFTNKVSINMIAGYSHAVEGAEFGGALNMSRSYVQGVQMSGGVNINGELTNGVQFAGISNITLADLKGWQAAGFSNQVDQASAVQMAGGMNFSKNMKGVQIAGMSNWNQYEYHGVQISGGLNYTRKLKGIQIGVVNVADSVAGGMMLGVVNWAKNGFHVLEFSSNDVAPYNLAFKSGVEAFYTILRAGINPHDNQLWDYGMGIGTLARWKEKTFIDLEATYHVIQPLDQRFIDGVNVSTRVQMRFGYRLANKIQLIGGPVLHFLFFKPKNIEDLSFADRFGRSTLSSTQTNSFSRKWWLGYAFAVRF